MNDPIQHFLALYQDAQNRVGENADVIALATATKTGRPSVRMVLYRGIREGGIAFFTNYDSRKAVELEENPFAAIVFYWDPYQIRIEGRIERLSDAESDRYFESRPLESRISAVLSNQSQPLTDEAQFISEWNAMQKSGAPCLRPPNWGGYKIIPDRFEFWTRGEYRRHRRLLYEKTADGWDTTRLYP